MQEIVLSPTQQRIYDALKAKLITDLDIEEAFPNYTRFRKRYITGEAMHDLPEPDPSPKEMDRIVPQIPPAQRSRAEWRHAAEMAGVDRDD